MSTVGVRLRRQRRWPLIVLGVVIALVVLFTLVSGFWIDLQWYHEVGFTNVFWTTLRTKFLLGLVGGVLFFGLLFTNLWIARRLRPTTRALTPDQEVIERIRETAEPYLRWLVPGVSLLFALLVGVGVSRQWQIFLLWKNSSGVVFGNPEPLFGRDPAFYIFKLPWLHFVQSWAFSSLVGVTFLTGIAHLLWGGIRPQAPVFADKVTPAVRAHLSVLLGLIMLVKAWGYYLGRFDLLTSNRGVVEGASYTDVKAQLPALNFLAIVAVICAVLFLVNIRVRLWSLPIIAVGLLAVVSVALGTAYPAFIQQFRVQPNEQTFELPYIDDNIAGTRNAFALTAVEESQRPVKDPLTALDLIKNATTVSNIRLWRPQILQENFDTLQRIKQYYQFNDVDVDRYTLNGDRRVLMVSGREIIQSGIPQGGTWQSQHLAYTHGFGAVAAQVNTATSEGQPQFTLKDIPPVGEPTIDQPRIYYGEGQDVPFVIVKSGLPEIDYEGATENQQYSGTGGIPVGGFLQRAMFAWKFRDVNLLISGDVKSDSRVMIYRDIYERVPKAVPFLSFDRDPYMSIVNGRLVWLWDAYTRTDQYPYSQSVELGQDLDLGPNGLFTGSVNYLRNSVKVAVDAYDGSITYYADLSDPIIQVWNRAFPGLFTDINGVDPALQAHFRYPEDLFTIQAYQYRTYHVTDAQTFYRRQDQWQIPDDPTVDVGPGELAPKLHPYYLQMRLPGEKVDGFYLVLPYVPEGRLNMVSWMAAASDPSDYGRLVVYRFPQGRNIEGPSQVFGRMNQDETFSEARTLLSSSGSKIAFGDFLVIPMEDTFLYAEPVYVRADQENSLPELKFVLLVNGSGGSVSQGATLADALQQAVGQTSGPGGPGQNPGGGSVDKQIQRLLTRAVTHFHAAQTALDAGDLGTYQAEIDEAQKLVQQAQDLANSGGGGTTPTGSPTPSASATPSASVPESPSATPS